MRKLHLAAEKKYIYKDHQFVGIVVTNDLAKFAFITRKNQGAKY